LVATADESLTLNAEIVINVTFKHNTLKSQRTSRDIAEDFREYIQKGLEEFGMDFPQIEMTEIFVDGIYGDDQ
jgi:hypothetical protein